MKIKISKEYLEKDVIVEINDIDKPNILKKNEIGCGEVACLSTGLACADCIFCEDEVIRLDDIILSDKILINEQKEKNKFMTISSELAKSGVTKGAGGPFGSVVVKDGVVVGYGHNTVVQDNDPTAHGEVNAIRDACKNLNTFDLSGCELYTTSEPCPMCLSAIMWSNIKKVYYGCTIKDAEEIGFRDVFIYDWLKERDPKVLNLQQTNQSQCLEVFELWKNKQDKTKY